MKEVIIGLMKTKIYKIFGIALALVMVFSLAGIITPARQSQAIDIEPVNSLRIYGEGEEDANFPYVDPQAPFDLTSDEATLKDFVVWNPAYMYHLDPESAGLQAPNGNFFQRIVVNGNDANEKVHLRQWYVPKYPEPRGYVWVDMEPELNPEIIKEYTWVLLDTDNNPIAGQPAPELTSFVFPIADNDPDQCGLDSYDAIVGDGVPADITVLNNFRDAFQWDPPGPAGIITAPLIDISTATLTVTQGQIIQFLDHAVEVVSLSSDSMMIRVYYGGNQPDAIIEQRSVKDGDLVSVGRHAVHVQNQVNETAIPQVEFRFDNASTWKSLRPVNEPWYLDVVDVTASAAFLRAGRLILEGETYFVDGLEYDVAKLYGKATASGVGTYLDNLDLSGGPDPEWEIVNPAPAVVHDKLDLKYITIRNPLPKVPVQLEPLTIIKCYFGPDETLPLLPPFNMEHDVIDDVNIPDDINEVDLDGNPVSHADEQYPDNVVDETGDTYGYGNDSHIKMLYNTIAKRRVEDVPPAIEYYIAETKEPRFDQNLLEEKFDITGVGEPEPWQWINIETLPWDYTELVLPEQTDKPTETGYDRGDYILVSSFVAPNSAHEEWDPVRVKFCYDAENGTGIYVNSYGVLLESPVADCGGPYAGEVDEMISISPVSTCGESCPSRARNACGYAPSRMVAMYTFRSRYALRAASMCSSVSMIGT